MQAILESEVEFQRGQVLIRKGDFAGAVQLLKHAVELYDQEPEYLVDLGWALYRNGKRISNEAMVREGKAFFALLDFETDYWFFRFIFLIRISYNL